ncbi:hypothetical protein JTE90_026048 [Oedothorax gibbosus]|uniref:Lysosome-associated membrane glycoprotein 5 n=1 Tax=Oedothorax gibbosus TaxID=931172 RepID=A0AAV6UDS3_9ARAC|nr:hypothetical protein JTE90_026048 [Oedothorax gibbosus]
MIFSGSKCFNIILLIYISFIVIAESKKKAATAEPPKEEEVEKILVTETILVEVDNSPKEEIEELEKLEKEDEAQQAADTKKELAEIEEALTEASKDLAEFEKIAEEMNTMSPKELEEEEKPKESEKSDEESEASTSETNQEETDEDKISASTSTPGMTTIEKQEAPEDTFAVWNTKGKICLLAKFDAKFTILYASEGGEQKAEVKLPLNANVKGKCETTTTSPLLQLSWQKYVFSVMFNKTEEDNWVVTSMDLTYDTTEGLFDKATNAGKKTARSKVLSIFETPMKRSHFCPAQEVVMLYNANKQAVTARLHNINLQPYDVEDAKFSPSYRCNKVVLDAEALIQDETVPLAVGLTFGLIALIVLVGFSIHRAINAAKADYNTMP